MATIYFPTNSNPTVQKLKTDSSVGSENNKMTEEETEAQIQQIFKQTVKKINISGNLSILEQEQKLDEALTQISKKILSQKSLPNHVIIRVHDEGGLGDLIFATKLAGILSKELPNTEIALVFKEEKTAKKIRSIIKNISYKLYLLEQLPNEFKNSKSGICIGAASIYNCYPSDQEKLEYGKMGLNDNYPYLLLAEYSAPAEPQKTKITGLSNHQYGIFIDQRLIQNSKSHQNPIEHMAKLSDAWLINAIKPDQKLSIQTYSDTTNLYFGYAHYSSSHKHFIRSVAHAEKGNKKNIDMVLVGDRDGSDRYFLESLVDEALLKELTEQGIGKIELVTETTTKSTTFLCPQSSRTLKIIHKKSISHDDLEICLLMSQPLSLITGDQSLSEAISTNKTFMYELYSHKIPLEKSLKELASQLNLSLVKKYLTLSGITVSDFTATYYNLPLEPHFVPYKGYYNQKSEHYDELSKLLLEKEFKNQWKTFITYIQENKSCDQKIASLVSRKLASLIYPSLSRNLWEKD